MIGYELLSFMDAYSSYNQSLMFQADQEDTSFITNRDLYYYKVIPFELKNTWATYQRLVNMIFVDLIDKTMEVYMDDMWYVDEPLGSGSCEPLREHLSILRKFRMRLNPLKCVFGVVFDKFL